MFASQLSRLRDEVVIINGVLAINEHVRNGLYSPSVASEVAPADGTASELSVSFRAEERRLLLGKSPPKLDWQVYDHCAALTRLYAAYERFVNDLISSYIGLLPDLYESYRELPEIVAVNHRMGVGQILVKIGSKKQYKELEEAAVVDALYSGFGVGPRYRLMPQAFLLEQNNYRFEILLKLFAGVGLENCGRSILQNSSLKDFLRTIRGEADTVQGELDRFIEYRNEAAHGSVDNILAPQEIEKIGEFVLKLAGALCDVVNSEVEKRHLRLGNSILVGTITEVHYKGYVAIAKMAAVHVGVGDEFYLCGAGEPKRARVEELHLNDSAIEELNAEVGQELGIKVSARVKIGNELRRVFLPTSIAPEQVPLFEVESEIPEDVYGASPIEPVEDNAGEPTKS